MARATPEGDIHMRDYVDRRMEDHCKTNGLWQEAHLREHEHMDQQVRLARENLDIRLDALNEWKERSIEDRVNFITKTEYESKHRELELAARGLSDKNELLLGAKTSEVNGRIEVLEERQQNANVWIRNLLVAVCILLVGVVVDLALWVTR